MSRTLVDLAAHYAKDEGLNPSPLDRLGFFRASEPTDVAPCLYEPMLVFVAQGRKRIYPPDGAIDFDPSKYLVVSVPLPTESSIIGATPETPFLGFGLTIDMAELGEMLLDMPSNTAASDGGFASLYATPISTRITDALERLLHTLESPQDCKILAPQICREIVYLALCDDKRGALRSITQLNGSVRGVARVLRSLHEQPAQSINVGQMADMAQMSQSGFFSAFKAVTGMTPVQYQKSIRLHRARNMILNEGLLISDAAYRVGYSTAAQFSRDYTRFFEKTARQDAAEASGAAVAFS